MAPCIGIEQEKIRAKIIMSGLEIYTPYVKAFNIEKARGQLVSTFSATVEISASSSFIAGSDIVIYDYVNNVERKRFTGTIKQITSNPSFDKAGYFTLSLSGTDKMGVLENKTFSRRLRSDGFSIFVSIDGGPSNRPSRGLSIDKRVRSGSHTMVSQTPRPTETDHTKVTFMPKRGNEKHGSYSKASSIGGTSESGVGGGITLHDHSTLSKGGPGFGVFSVD